MASNDKLSSLEKFFYDRSRLNLHSCFFLGIQLNRIPDRPLLAHALRSTIACHPRLHQNVAVDPQDKRPFVKDIPSIILDEVVEYTDFDDFDEQSINHIFRSYNFAYGTEKPLWKLLVHEREKRLFLLVDHALFDGISTVLFWKAFVGFLQEEDYDENDVLYVSTGEPVKNDRHAYDKLSSSWSLMIKKFALGTLFKLIPSMITSAAKNQLQFKNYSFPQGLLVPSTNNEVPYQIRNDNCQLNVKIEPARLNGILSECKRHQVSLTSFMAAVFSLCLRTKLTNECYTGTCIKIDVPMNTRGACSDVLQTKDFSSIMGNFVAPLACECNLSAPNGVWNMAKTFQADIRRQSTTNFLETVSDVRLLDAVDTADFVRQKLKSSGPAGTFEVTNLGYQDFGVSGDSVYHVKDAVFNEPQGLSDIFTCAMISTPGSGLNCCISYPKDIMSDVQPCFNYFREYFEKGYYLEDGSRWS